MFRNFFNFLQAMATTEARAVRYGIIFMTASVAVATVLQYFLDGGDTILIFCIFVIVANAWWIFSPSRIAAVCGVGEIAELLRFFPARTINGIPLNGFPFNEPGGIYWATIKNVFYFLVAYLLTLPFIPLANWRGSVIVLPVLLILTGICFGSAGAMGIRVIGRLAVICLGIFALCNIFPQIGYYTGVYKITGGVVSSKASGLSNKTERLRSKQRAVMMETAQQSILTWQENNPGKDTPADLLLGVTAAQQGLSLAELQARLKAEADAKAKAEAEAKAKAEKAEAEAKAKAQAEAKALELRRQAEKLEAEKNKIKTISNGYVLRPATDGGVVCLTMQAGHWNVFPADTKLKEVEDAMPRVTGGMIFVPREKTSCFFPSPGTREIVLTKK